MVVPPLSLLQLHTAFSRSQVAVNVSFLWLPGRNVYQAGIHSEAPHTTIHVHEPMATSHWLV